MTPTTAALRWAAEQAGPSASAHVVRRLEGGTHAVTHLLETTDPARQMVLRCYPAGDDAAAREAAILSALDGLDDWAPRLVDVDPAGERLGAPAILITRLPGRADLATPPAVAAEQLGVVLARLHAVPLTRLGGLRTLPGPPSLARSPSPLVLTHHDFWSGNVLWEDERISGVVDWSGAGRAPRGFDVSWCRLDLFLLHGAAAAGLFLDAYQQAAGSPVADLPEWDRFALANSERTVETWVPNYAGLGRTDLTAAELRARHTAWAQVVHFVPEA